MNLNELCEGIKLNYRKYHVIKIENLQSDNKEEKK